MKLINADTVVHWQAYDDEHETFPEHEGTITEFLDAMTDEGCPESVDAVPVVHGRWIPNEDENGDHYGDKCSECGEWYVMPFRKTNFCPNCGAKMDGEDGEQE